MIRSRASRFAILLLLLTLTAFGVGCGVGGDDRDARTADAEPSPPPAERTAPPQSGVTAGRLGDASTRDDDDAKPSVSEGGRFDVSPPDAERRLEGVGAGDACPGTDAEASANLRAIVAATTCLLNGERRDRGLPALTPNAALLKAARVHARSMVANSFFSHTGRDGTQSGDRIKSAGYLRGASSWMVGENLAWGSGAMSTPKIIMRAWMNSPGHRENILEPDYRDLGVVVVTGNPASADGSGATYVTEFGFRKTATQSKPRRSRSSSAASRARGR